MPTYIWTGKDKLGKSVVREIFARTSNEAQAVLLAEGCSALKLMQDDVGAAAMEGMPRTIHVMGEPVAITAEERVKHYNKPRKTYFRVLREGVGRSVRLLLIIILVGGFQFYRGNTTGVLFAGVALAAWLGFLLCVGLPSIYYEKLHRADDWHRWSEVLELVKKMERIRSIHFIKVPLPELGRFRAKALAASGKVEEALVEYQRFENQPGCPTWLHTAFLGSICDTAKQHDKALDYNLKAIAQNPIPTLYRDLANRYARYKKNPGKAREAMNEADKSVISEIGKPFRLRCLGIIAYLEGDCGEARRNLEIALQMMEQTRDQPYRDGGISVTKAYLCCVLAKLGDLKAARQCLSEAKEYLVATDESELLADCNEAVKVL